MASFILPSSIQKRLLRYALSRLELLDTDALDLEHLDINWGTKSTLEFRNVGLKLKVGYIQFIAGFAPVIRMPILAYKSNLQRRRTAWLTCAS